MAVDPLADIKRQRDEARAAGVKAAATAALARLEVERLQVEVEQLRRWRTEATLALNEWDKVYQALGQPGALGDSLAAASLAEIKRLRDALERRNAQMDSLYLVIESMADKIQRVRDLAKAAKPGVSLSPLDCTNMCSQGDCDCSGEFRVVEWTLDPAAVVAILDGESHE